MRAQHVVGACRRPGAIDQLFWNAHFGRYARVRVRGGFQSSRGCDSSCAVFWEGADEEVLTRVGYALVSNNK